MHNAQQNLSNDAQVPSRELHIHYLGNVTMSISYWDEGITWQINNQKDTNERSSLFDDEPSLNMLANDDDELQKWLAVIPEEVRTKACKYSSYFAILYLTSHYKVAYQLFISHPTLFWLLLTVAKENYWTEDKLLSTMSLPRTDISVLCGLPANRSAVKLLSKLDFIQFDVVAVTIINKLLLLDNHHKLNHCKQLHHRLVIVLLDHPELIGSKLIYHLSQCKWCDGLDTTLKDIIRLGRHLDMDTIMERLLLLQSAEQVQRLHDELVERVNKKNNDQQQDELEKIIYPEPPILENEYIIPIRNKYELVQEGIEQENCVASYNHDIVAGDYYVYKVICSERATLGLVRTKNDQFKLDQLYLKGNNVVSVSTAFIIQRWMDEFGRMGGIL